MARSTKSMQDQLALVEYGENLVNQLRAKTPDGDSTRHLSDSEESLLDEVINLVRLTMYASMQGAHDTDQLVLNTKADQIDACNTNLNAALGGTVSDAETAFNTARTAHIECREEEAALYLHMTGKQTDLHLLISNIPPAPSVPATLVKTLDGVIAYFDEAQFYVDWYNTHSAEFETERTSSETASASHAQKRTTCNTKQTAFETDYLLWKERLEDTCSEYCHAAQTTLYDGLKLEFAPLVENRKKAYLAGEILVSKIECLLGRNDCSDVTPSDAQWSLNPRETQGILACSTTAVQHAVCDQAFRDANYNAVLPNDAQEENYGC